MVPVGFGVVMANSSHATRDGAGPVSSLRSRLDNGAPVVETRAYAEPMPTMDRERAALLLGVAVDAGRAEVTAALSRLINLEGVERLLADAGFADPQVRAAVESVFDDGGFDFSKKLHREMLGKAMIDLRYEALK